MTRTARGRSRRMGIAVLVAGVGLGVVPVASAAQVGPIGFEPPAYTVGDINGQQGWMKTGAFDAGVVAVAGFPSAAGFRFGTQALRISDAVTSGSFSDQTFSPGVKRPAGESTRYRHFEGRFRIATTKPTEQPGLHISVSPDDGQGSRMSYLRFEDKADGVHVFFVDVTDPGPLGTVANFNETEIKTLSRDRAHRVRFSIDIKPGPANDVVRIYLDGKMVRLQRAKKACGNSGKGKGHDKDLGKTCTQQLRHGGRPYTGTTWEDYYRFDPEQTGNGNVVPTVAKLLFRSSGTANPVNAGQGFLIDGVRLQTSKGSPGGK